MDNVPAYLTNAPTSNFADDAVHGLGGVRPPSLSIAKQNFTAIDAGGNERPVANFDQIQGSPTFGKLYAEVILIDANKAVSKKYYSKQYDPNAADFSPPDCWSDNGVAPSSAADLPQSPTCAACPHNQWGSKINANGNQSKACSDSKKVAVLIPVTGSDMPFLLSIPPATLNKHWSPYIRMLAQQNLGNRRMTPSDVVTRITFDAATQGVLNFSPVGFISQEQLAQVQRAQAADLTAQIVGKNDQPHQGALPAPAAQPQLAAQAPIPQQAPVQQFQTAPQNSGYVPPAPTTGQPPQMQQAQPFPPTQNGVLTMQPATTYVSPVMPLGQTPQFAAQQFAPSVIAQQPQQEPVRRTRRGRTNPPAEQAPVQPQQVQQPVQQAPAQQFAPQQGQAPVHPPAAPAFMSGGQQSQPLTFPPQQTLTHTAPLAMPPGSAQAPSHGMVSAPPPTAELAATLANAFGPQGGN